MRRFWINSLGEFGTDEQLGDMKKTKILGGSYAVADALRAEGIDPQLGPMSRTAISEVIGRHHIKRAKKMLTPKEFALFELHNELLDLHTATFRFNGGIRDDEPYLCLSFEFYLYQDEKAAPDRKAVADFIEWLRTEKRLNLNVERLDEGIENEHSWRIDENGEKIPDSDRYGENHGRSFVQSVVEIDLLTTKMKKTDVEPLIKDIRAEMVKQRVLHHTVGVL